jgi:hypothetical protein
MYVAPKIFYSREMLGAEVEDSLFSFKHCILCNLDSLCPYAADFTDENVRLFPTLEAIEATTTSASLTGKMY